MAARRGTRKSEIPFGPYMILAAMIAIFAANPLADAYLNLIGNK
jgi:leader peptidase (prepilin peptidase)/N-methyltransferase